MTPCLCAATRQAARAITLLYESEMQASGLHPAQFELLSWVAANNNASQMALARAIGADQTTLSRNLKRLLQNRLIAAETDAADKRQVLYRLTGEGRETLKVAAAGWNRAQKKMERALGTDWNKTRDLLARLVEATAA